MAGTLERCCVRAAALLGALASGAHAFRRTKGFNSAGLPHRGIRFRIGVRARRGVPQERYLPRPLCLPGTRKRPPKVPIQSCPSRSHRACCSYARHGQTVVVLGLALLAPISLHFANTRFLSLAWTTLPNPFGLGVWRHDERPLQELSTPILNEISSITSR
jgi:hypothetical protein